MPESGFVLCRKCPHRAHKGAICRYPTQLLRTPGMPLDLCGCSFGMWLHDAPVVDLRQEAIKTRYGRAFKSGNRRVNVKPAPE